VTVGAYCERLLFDAFHFGHFKNVRAVSWNLAEEFAEIFARMENRLVRKTSAGQTEKRHDGSIVGANAEIDGNLDLAFQLLRMFVVGILQGRVEKTRNPLEIAGDFFSADVGDDAIDRGRADIPHGLCALAAECVHEFV
jgi:hypothetical protein